MRWFKAVGGLLTIMLIVTSCLKVESTIVIDDDGSGTVDFLTALNTESLTSVLGDFDIPESELGGADELCEGFEEDFGSGDEFPTGSTVTPYQEDGFCGTRVQYSLSASTDHSAAIEEVFDDTVRLYKEGDNWFFESQFNADEITSEAEGAPAGMVDALFGDASIKFVVDLPGRAVDGQNNATSVGDDGRFTWDIDILNPPARLFAQTEPGSGGGSGGGGGISGLLIGLIVLGLIGAAAAYWFLKMRPASNAGAPAMTGDALASPFPAPGAPSEPPVGATAVIPQAVMPESDATKETVLMNPAEAQRLAESAAGDATDTADAVTGVATGAAAAAAPEPVYDEALGAWTVQDPVRGLLRHDPATDTWNPA